MSMAIEVMKLIFAALDVPFNSGHYTVIIKRQFLYINCLKRLDKRHSIAYYALMRDSCQSIDEKQF